MSADYADCAERDAALSICHICRLHRPGYRIHLSARTEIHLHLRRDSSVFYACRGKKPRRQFGGERSIFASEGES